MRQRWADVRLGRGLLFLAGVILVGWLVHVAQGERVILVLGGARQWLPFIIAFELALLMTDLFAIRILLGDKRHCVSPSAWTRAMTLAYAASICLPLGRAAGEGVRAATLERCGVSSKAAISACVRLQASALLGNAAISMIGLAALATLAGPSRIFGAALLGNAVLCTGLSGLLLWGLHSTRFTRWLVARFPRLAFNASSADHELGAGRRTAAAASLCLFGRFIQTAQYGAVLAAVGCQVTPSRALMAQGIQLVGAAAGDFVPNQMGATESAFFFFGKSLRLTDEPARVLAMALIIRLTQFGLASACVFLAALVGETMHEAPER